MDEEEETFNLFETMLYTTLKTDSILEQWRMRGKMKTLNVALVLCLNIGVDPPNVIKADPCAKLECWFDPTSLPPHKAVETIGKNLQIQYERWQPRAKYKSCLDPTDKDIKKICTSLRRTAKDERVLFHYNGHGVPEPTEHGEIWVFNENFTQYIPLSLFDLQTWVGSPGIFIFDCSGAGIAVKNFIKFMNRRKSDIPADFIILGACSENETLPTSHLLPADLFTSCLTTPLKMALQWYIDKTELPGVTPELIERIPGKLGDRKTPLGELSWIFTAITDTIAWDLLDRKDFQKFFRQDLLVASLCRNYILAERIMRSCRITTVSYPELPQTYHHPMWNSWDLAVDHCLEELKKMKDDPNYQYEPTTFFEDQLTAFELWLDYGAKIEQSPEQLTILIQVLLSLQHRSRTLKLLGRFLDMGAWAINLGLSVGIFPYVLRLIKVKAPELRKTLVFIWSKILSLDVSCQFDLVKENSHKYFISVMANTRFTTLERIRSAFVLSSICNNCIPGQRACLSGQLLSVCLKSINSEDPLLRRWIILCLAKLWENEEQAKREAIMNSAHKKLCLFLRDPVPEVRAATVYALGTFIGNFPEDGDENIDIELNLGLTFPVLLQDANPIVRREVIITTSKILSKYEDHFVDVIAGKLIQNDRERMSGGSDNDNEEIHIDDSESDVFIILWTTLVKPLLVDPYPKNALLARYLLLKTIRDKAYDIRGRSNSNEKVEVVSPDEPSSPKYTRRKKGSTIGKFLTASGTHKSSPRERSPMRLEKPAPERDVIFDIPENEIVSEIYELSCEMFSKPFSQKQQKEKPSSLEMWRTEKNSERIREADEGVEVNTLNREIALCENDCEKIGPVLFHRYDDIVFFTRDPDTVAIWNWQDDNMKFLKNISRLKISSLSLLKENSLSPLVCIGTVDGVIRIWNNVYNSGELLTSWRSIFPEDPLISSKYRRTKLVLEWQEENRRVFAGGPYKVIKLWDIEKELPGQYIETCVESPLVCMNSVPQQPDLVIGGFLSGEIGIYDIRAGTESQIALLNQHNSYVIKTYAPKTRENTLISGDGNGSIKMWDIRNKECLNSFQTDTMDCLDIHENTEVIAIGSTQQRIKLIDFQGEQVGKVVKYHDGFLGNRIGEISSIKFHPYRPLIAAGSRDRTVSIHTVN